MDTAAGEREVAVAGTYQEVPKVDEEGNDMRQGLGAILMAPTRGIQAASDVVAFVLLIGGSFAILTKTNAINAGMSRVIKKLKGKDILLIPVVMLLFSIGGTSFGMSEEALPFYAIFMPIIMSLGYDSMTAFMVCFLGPQMGYIGSTVNPFNVLIAQGVAGIQGNPQLWFRFIQYATFTIIGIVWVMMYARKVKKNPTGSITYQDDLAKREEFAVDSVDSDMPFTLRQKLVLIVFGVMKWLDVYTRHGEAVVVPDVKGMTVDEASKMFRNHGLVCVVSDSNYVKNMAAGIVLDVNPGIGQKVKEGRTIYLTINTLSIPLRAVPDVADNSSLRQAQAKVLAAGFKLTEIQLMNGEKDWVYGIKYQGRSLNAGDKVPLGAALTLMVGNGENEPLESDSMENVEGADEPVSSESPSSQDDSWF